MMMMRDQNWGEPNTPYYRRQEMLWNLWLEQLAQRSKEPETVKLADVSKYLVVSNARMLVDLAAAGRLDTLLRPEVVVVVTDVVREVLIRLGARDVLQWIRDQRDESLYMASTTVWFDFYRPGKRTKTELSESDAVDEIVDRLRAKGRMVEIL